MKVCMITNTNRNGQYEPIILKNKLKDFLKKKNYKTEKAYSSILKAMPKLTNYIINGIDLKHLSLVFTAGYIMNLLPYTFFNIEIAIIMLI